MVGLACISKCVVCEKGRRIGMAAAVLMRRRRRGRRGGRKRRSRNLACTSINLHLLVRASLARGALWTREPLAALELSIRVGHTPVLSILTFKFIRLPRPILSRTRHHFQSGQWTSNHLFLQILFAGEFSKVKGDYRLYRDKIQSHSHRDACELHANTYVITCTCIYMVVIVCIQYSKLTCYKMLTMQ